MKAKKTKKALRLRDEAVIKNADDEQEKDGEEINFYTE
jgi:hypothetical protein